MPEQAARGTPPRPWSAGPQERVRPARIVPAAGSLPRARAALVVDADADARRIAATALAHAGFRVLTGRSGEDAVRLALEERPDLVVMEVRLPGVDGLRALEVLRAEPRTAHLPVVLLTTHADPATEALARAAGCAEYLRKPCPLALLIAAAERVTGAARDAPAA